MTSQTALAEEQYRLGLAAARRGELAVAESHFRAAVDFQPKLAQAHNNLGVSLEMQGQAAVAVDAYRRAIAIRPDYAEAYHNLGVALEQVGQYQAAADSCRQAIALKPDFIAAYNGLGVALERLGQFEEAAQWLQRVVVGCPDFAEGHSNLAAVYQKLGKLESALSLLERAIQMRPDNPAAHVNLGLVYERLAQLSAAGLAFEKSLKNDLNCSEAQLDEGLARHRVIDSSMAEQSFRHALSLNPECAEAHCNLALTKLRQGNFAEGWREYRWRYRAEGREEPSFARPRWDGSSLAGRTILLCDDQGAGDNIQFVRYAEQLAQQGGHVILRCGPRLAKLLRSCPGVQQVVTEGDVLPRFDVYLPLPDVPGAVGTTVDSIPAKVPYLFPSEADVASWREEWRDIRELKVGIAWQGCTQNKADYERSISLEHFSGLGDIPGVRLISLQFGSGREQLTQLQTGPIIDDLGERLGDFHQTAAIVRNLDLVITCDSSPAHLAGALGVPVWVALAYLPDWRWLLERTDSPWYPTMRLFRQSKPGDWTGVFKQIGSELRIVSERHAQQHIMTSQEF